MGPGTLPDPNAERGARRPEVRDQDEERCPLLELIRGGEGSRAGWPVRCFFEVGGERSGENVGEPEPSGGNLRCPFAAVKNEPGIRENSATATRGGIAGPSSSGHDQLEWLEVVPIEAPVPRQQPVRLDEGVGAHQEVGHDALLPAGSFPEPVPALRGAERRLLAHG